VGMEIQRSYFSVIDAPLTPGGIAMSHAITSEDAASRSVGVGAGESIDQDVFPDGELPHVSLAIRELSAAGLELVDAESLRRHYALTCGHWSRRFERSEERRVGKEGRWRWAP